ncbi:MAG TPA: universal stress protein [Pyrinomonadaceae bacterium]|nr:universal stress protein [Pyrinomonadaceae bacterium]
MKIFIAYDGSEAADIAIDSMRRAGLPKEGVEALVMSVGEVWLPPATGTDDETFPQIAPPGLKQAREHAEKVMQAAREGAERGAERVRQNFPRWHVTHEAQNGSPAFELLNRAEAWQADLIVVGSHGHTAISRFVLGSVSQKILTEASVAVHVGRAATGTGASGERIVIGVDGSPGSHAAIKAAARRNWTTGSELRIVVVDDALKGSPIWLLIPPVRDFLEEVRTEERTQSERMGLDAVKELRAALNNDKITVSSVVETGDPKQMLIKHAEDFGADCIFTGATGFSNRLERLVLGSVSAAVAARAQCSVEVVREREAVTDRE